MNSGHRQAGIRRKGERTRKRTFYFKIVVMGIESGKVPGGGDENVFYILYTLIRKNVF
jgi:hypothetical protein